MREFYNPMETLVGLVSALKYIYNIDIKIYINDPKKYSDTIGNIPSEYEGYSVTLFADNFGSDIILFSETGRCSVGEFDKKMYDKLYIKLYACLLDSLSGNNISDNYYELINIRKSK